MEKLHLPCRDSSFWFSSLHWLPAKHLHTAGTGHNARTRRRHTSSAATKAGKFSLNVLAGSAQGGKRCQDCGGHGAIECPGCKGTGKNKQNGNIFERWKCFDCQGFGLKSCPSCGKGGLTPEQRGER